MDYCFHRVSRRRNRWKWSWRIIIKISWCWKNNKQKLAYFYYYLSFFCLTEKMPFVNKGLDFVYRVWFSIDLFSHQPFSCFNFALNDSDGQFLEKHTHTLTIILWWCGCHRHTYYNTCVTTATTTTTWSLSDRNISLPSLLKLCLLPLIEFSYVCL